MDRAIEVWEGEGGAPGRVASKIAQSARRYRTLWIGVLHAAAIIVVLAFVAKLY